MFPAGSRNLAVILGAFHHRFTRAKAVCERRSECLGRNCWQIKVFGAEKTGNALPRTGSDHSRGLE